MLYHFTERGNQLSDLLMDDFEHNSPLVPHSASKYTQRGKKVKNQKIQVLRNSLKI